MSNSVISSKMKSKSAVGEEEQLEIFLFSFSERMSSFSLKIRAIGPLDFDGARRENVLRGVGYAWTPDLWSFLKLQEVGFSPYLGFIPIFNVFRMFESIEAIRGCWIGPKTWDRINIIFLKPNGAARSCSTAVWV